MADLSDLPFQELIVESDRFLIQNTRTWVSSKYQRSRRLEHFEQCLRVLTGFVDLNGEIDWKRALLCGFCKCGDALAVNNARLQTFMGRCKSSINDLFAKMGYHTMPINQNNQNRIIAKIPFLRSHNEELRQWTYRVHEESNAQLDCYSGDVVGCIAPEERKEIAESSPSQSAPENNSYQYGPSDSLPCDDWGIPGDDFFQPTERFQ
jgi:hypothetical protein